MLKSFPSRLGVVLVAAALTVGLAAVPAEAAAKPKATLSGTSSLTVPSTPTLKYKMTHLPSGKKVYQLQKLTSSGKWKKVVSLRKASGTVKAPSLGKLGAYTYRVVAIQKVKGKSKVIAASKRKTVKAYGEIPLASICAAQSTCATGNVVDAKLTFPFVVSSSASYYAVSTGGVPESLTMDLFHLKNSSCASINFTWLGYVNNEGGQRVFNPATLSLFRAKSGTASTATSAPDVPGVQNFTAGSGAIDVSMVVSGAGNVVNGWIGNNSTLWATLNGSALCYTETGEL